jgi:hypothetical protein
LVEHAKRAIEERRKQGNVFFCFIAFEIPYLLLPYLPDALIAAHNRFEKESHVTGQSQRMSCLFYLRSSERSF